MGILNAADDLEVLLKDVESDKSRPRDYEISVDTLNPDNLNGGAAERRQTLKCFTRQLRKSAHA